MKKNFYFIIFLLSIFSTTYAQVIERIGVKGPIEFNLTKFSLAWSEKPNADYFVQEYLPKNETLENFNKLITINVFVTDITIENAIQQKVNQLTKRKETDKVSNFSVINSPDGKESIIDCVLSAEKNGELNIVEFIIYRYKQIELKNQRKALLIYSYSKRSYGKNIPSFFKKLKNERVELLNIMISQELPKIDLNE